MDLIKKLHPLEKRVISALKNYKDVDDIIKFTGLKEVEVTRALQWLRNKDVLKVNVSSREAISLGKNGVSAIKEGLPERRLLNLLKVGPISMNNLKLSKDEANVALGILRSRFAIEAKKNEISLTEKGNSLLNKNLDEEEFLYKISESNRYVDELIGNDKLIFNNLRKRKEILSVNLVKERNIELTELGKSLLKKDLGLDLLEGVTPDLIRSDTWKKKNFREYDISLKVPRIYPGKRHFTQQAVQYIKNIWLEMGFTEMSGNLVQSAFWDLDSLFVPQDHPARDMQDTFYIKGDKGVLKTKLPGLKSIVKSVHENGGNTGSKGWRYKWDEEKASELLLRTHTTVLSALTLSKLKNYPAKFFVVGNVFRNETLSWKHLFEFYQVEGIVVDENANLRNLFGYLKEFYKKMGYRDVRLRPAHFPYTEPSLEVDVLHPVKNEWIELGGAGIFRPEVSKMLLGKEIPILAWGQGMERIISAYYNIKDIREVYGNNIKMLREIRAWMK